MPGILILLFLTMQTFFLKSLIQNLSHSGRKWEASNHQQQMKRNCSEWVPREGWIWRSHCERGCLLSLKTCVSTVTGFYAFLLHFVSCSSYPRNNVIILWRLMPELELSRSLSFSWGHSDNFKYSNGTKAVAPGLSGRHSLPSLLFAEGFYFSTLVANPHSDFEEFQNICRISAFRIFYFEIFYCTK